MHDNDQEITENIGSTEVDQSICDYLGYLPDVNGIPQNNLESCLNARLNYLLSDSNYPKNKSNFSFLYSVFTINYRYEIWVKLIEFEDYFDLVEIEDVRNALLDKCKDFEILQDLFNDFSLSHKANPLLPYFEMK